jgi:hypothetical protein
VIYLFFDRLAARARLRFPRRVESMAPASLPGQIGA